MKQWAQAEIQDIPFKHKENLFTIKSSNTTTGFSILVETENLSEWSLKLL